MPDLKHGYSIDDSARALIAVIWYADLYGERGVGELAEIYLKHIQDAQLPDGRFHNFKDKNGQFLDEVGSDDSYGRTIWALGVAATSTFVDRDLIQSILTEALPYTQKLTYPRSIAFSILGLIAAGQMEQAVRLGDRLIRLYRDNSSPDWTWFEPCLTYSNAILPSALLSIADDAHRSVALESLAFLNGVSRVNGTPAPIGFDGWYCRGKERALFGQQAIDAADMVLANLKALEDTGKEGYRQEALDWFGWFFGNNVSRAVMVTKGGGCFDGIWQNKINTNQGAESTVVYLLAHLALARALDAH